jgi:hypothetical protein
MLPLPHYVTTVVNRKRDIQMIRWRHLIVAIGLVPALIIYIGLVMQIADMLTGIHMLLDLLFYIVAGLAWIPAASKVVKWLATHESH